MITWPYDNCHDNLFFLLRELWLSYKRGEPEQEIFSTLGVFVGKPHGVCSYDFRPMLVSEDFFKALDIVFTELTEHNFKIVDGSIDRIFRNFRYISAPEGELICIVDKSLAKEGVKYLVDLSASSAEGSKTTFEFTSGQVLRGSLAYMASADIYLAIADFFNKNRTKLPLWKITEENKFKAANFSDSKLGRALNKYKLID